MSEYIKRQDAIEALTGWETEPTDMDIEWALNSISATDVVEVVRCKDCVYFKPVIKNHNGVGNCRHSVGLVTENHYCSYGKLRDTNG